MTGAEFYTVIDDWYEETRVQLAKIVREHPEPFRTPQDIQKPLQTMRYAMECEGMLIKLVNRDLSLFEIEDMELKLRGIRDSLVRMVSDSIVRGLNIYGYHPSDYGMSVQMLENGGFSIDIPYNMISMSELFMVRSKRISALSSLSTVREAWVGLISSVCEDIKLQGSYPLGFANITVLIEVVHKWPLDPDHFWVRPIIDGLCEMGILVNDNANTLNFIQQYKMRADNNRVQLSVIP